MSSPLFSIIIPTYDRPELLAEAVDSVLGQTVHDFECLVVDDAGPGQVKLPEDPRFILIRRDSNGGEPAARNTGLARARGRFIAFLDDDDRFAPERLALAMEGLERAPVAICWRRSLDGGEGNNRVLDGDVRDSILNAMTPQIGQVAFVAEGAPDFDERFAALTDVEWLLRVAYLHPFATVRRVGLLYRTHDGPRNRNGLSERVRCSRLLLDVHADYFASHRRARAFRWKRIGLMADRLGDRTLARRALVRSLRSRIEPATFAHLARTLEPGRRETEEPQAASSVGGSRS